MENNETKLPTIHPMLDVSTAHFRVETLNWLSEVPNDFIVFPKEEYGYFIPIIEETLTDEVDIPDDLRAVIKFAQGQGCTWIMIDRDALFIDELPELYVG